MNLKLFLLESLDKNFKQELLKTPEDAYEYFFGDKKDSKEYDDVKKSIKYLYDLAYESPQKFDKDGNPVILYPFVKNYNKTKDAKTFAVRRWVSTNTEWMKYCTDNNINPEKFFKNIGDKKTPKDIYHDTNIQNIDKFPDSTDHEILIAMSANIKSFKQVGKKSSYEESLKYALFGDKEELKPSEKEVYEKFLKWYESNKEYVENLASNINVNTEDGNPELFCKLQSGEVTVSSDWKKNENSDKKPNKTPKADIISNKGKSISIKNGDTGAQAMSGSKDETMATLLRFKHLLDDDDQKKLESLFEYNWNDKDSDRNSKLNDTIKQIFDKEKNPKFVISVLAESITGGNKFDGDKGSASTILTFTNGECVEEDAESYVYNTFKQFDVKNITINHKSSKSTWAAMRILLPKYNKSNHEKLDDNEKNSDLFKAMLEVTDKIKNKTKHFDDSEIEFEDEDKDGHPRQHKTGPQGGKYYRVKIDGKWGPWNSDPDKK